MDIKVKVLKVLTEEFWYILNMPEELGENDHTFVVSSPWYITNKACKEVWQEEANRRVNKAMDY